MIETDQLEAMVIAIHNRTCRSSEAFVEEYFAETIEQKLEQLPRDSRDEFMRIAIDHGYKTLAERSGNCTPESVGFDDDYYEDLFLLQGDDTIH